MTRDSSGSLKPILYHKNAFDAMLDTTFECKYEGNQATATELRIRQKDSLSYIYDEKIEGLSKLTHTLPAKTLSNGNQYYASIKIYYKSSTGAEASTSFSEEILFYCFSTPKLVFLNLDSVIRSSSLIFNVKYMQGNGGSDTEFLNTYRIQLYDAGGIEIYDREYRAASDTSETNTFQAEHSISALDDNAHYSIKCTGTTVNGMVVDTGYYEFSVDYSTPTLFSRVQLENMRDDGEIKISTNIITIEGESNPSPPLYVSDDTMIDLTQDGSYVEYNEGFVLNGNYTLSTIRTSLKDRDKFTIITGDNGVINLTYRIVKFQSQPTKTAFVELRIDGDVSNYYIMSNLITAPITNDKIHIWMRHVDGLYTVKIANLGDSGLPPVDPDAIDADMLGGLTPEQFAKQTDIDVIMVKIDSIKGVIG